MQFCLKKPKLQARFLSTRKTRLTGSVGLVEAFESHLWMDSMKAAGVCNSASLAMWPAREENAWSISSWEWPDCSVFKEHECSRRQPTSADNSRQTLLFLSSFDALSPWQWRLHRLKSTSPNSCLTTSKTWQIKSHVQLLSCETWLSDT